ncbi:uncharacterized protein BDR25DRAFT_363164 [Lindgomyces ingoldianus]|uniref:Uncharacterized protein n=1 Tax=Lindgomyces ingoldianus TaxID=673940 RepID=A0ACB6Q878_9PLEO|nr:uncharacterized protein BDR25DRAFT_363164 [Lindgomyces ingoldianus]KAF2463076.1 hypothetical protein BDR25DRAFT_363164 [Lindgomyces ingoldianus]
MKTILLISQHIYPSLLSNLSHCPSPAATTSLSYTSLNGLASGISKTLQSYITLPTVSGTILKTTPSHCDKIELLRVAAALESIGQMSVQHNPSMRNLYLGQDALLMGSESPRWWVWLSLSPFRIGSHKYSVVEDVWSSKRREPEKVSHHVDLRELDKANLQDGRVVWATWDFAMPSVVLIFINASDMVLRKLLEGSFVGNAFAVESLRVRVSPGIIVLFKDAIASPASLHVLVTKPVETIQCFEYWKPRNLFWRSIKFCDSTLTHDWIKQGRSDGKTDGGRTVNIAIPVQPRTLLAKPPPTTTRYPEVPLKSTPFTCLSRALFYSPGTSSNVTLSSLTQQSHQSHLRTDIARTRTTSLPPKFALNTSLYSQLSMARYKRGARIIFGKLIQELKQYRYIKLLVDCTSIPAYTNRAYFPNSPISFKPSNLTQTLAGVCISSNYIQTTSNPANPSVSDARQIPGQAGAEAEVGVATLYRAVVRKKWVVSTGIAARRSAGRDSSFVIKGVKLGRRTHVSTNGCGRKVTAKATTTATEY